MFINKQSFMNSLGNKEPNLIIQKVKHLTLDPNRLSRLEVFLKNFKSVFKRTEQFQRFKSYVLGLLCTTTERKNFESIARAISQQSLDNSQSLQHFVCNSPWNHHNLGQELFNCTAKYRFDSKAILFIHDGVFAKKGNHTTGVQRQFARSLGKKINCQIGVFISQIGPLGFFPLAAQLYLPANWLRENPAKISKQVPKEYGVQRTKAEIALDLLTRIKEWGKIELPVFAEPGYISDEKFLASLADNGFSIAENSELLLKAVSEKFNWLNSDFGLDHFEGRTWNGWHHHVMLVFVAYHFLANECRFYN
jgi:SRSO17 transposase